MNVSEFNEGAFLEPFGGILAITLHPRVQSKR